MATFGRLFLCGDHMQSSNAPTKIQLPFAATGTKNTIPVPSQQGITPGAASYTDGFPPLTFTPLSAGGVPPAGADFNGIFNALSAIQQWQSAGGLFKYDASFSTAVGGYPAGAVLLNASASGLWISTSDNNTTNPDTGGSGWIAFGPSSVQSGMYVYAVATGTANAHAVTLNPGLTARVDGMVIRYKAPAANTGALTLNDGLGAVAVVGAAHAALQGGETVMNGDVWVQWNSSIGGGCYIMVDSTGGAAQVAAGAQSNQAVNLGQFGNSLAGNGYQKLPSGMIIQWLSGTIGFGTSTTLNFPIAFPNNCFAAFGNVQNNTAGYALSIAGTTKTTVSGYHNAPTNQQVYIFAIGS